MPGQSARPPSSRLHHYLPRFGPYRAPPQVHHRARPLHHGYHDLSRKPGSYSDGCDPPAKCVNSIHDSDENSDDDSEYSWQSDSSVTDGFDKSIHDGHRERGHRHLRFPEGRTYRWHNGSIVTDPFLVERLPTWSAKNFRRRKFLLARGTFEVPSNVDSRLDYGIDNMDSLAAARGRALLALVRSAVVRALRDALLRNEEHPLLGVTTRRDRHMRKLPGVKMDMQSSDPPFDQVFRFDDVFLVDPLSSSIMNQEPEDFLTDTSPTEATNKVDLVQVMADVYLSIRRGESIDEQRQIWPLRQRRLAKKKYATAFPLLADAVQAILCDIPRWITHGQWHRLEKAGFSKSFVKAALHQWIADTCEDIFILKDKHSTKKNASNLSVPRAGPSTSAQAASSTESSQSTIDGKPATPSVHVESPASKENEQEDNEEQKGWEQPSTSSVDGEDVSD